MGKKFTYKEVKLYVEENSNCELLSTEYIDIKSKLKFKCSCGDIFYTVFDSFKGRNKRHCKKCGLKISREKQNFSFEYVKNFIETNSNSKLLSKKYVNTKSKLLLLCSCGKKFHISFEGFKLRNKTQCNTCNREKSNLKKRLEFDYVKNFITLNSNCKLLSKVYENYNSKLLLKCNCGNSFQTSFNKFKNRNKRQCDECGKILGEQSKLIPYEKIKEFIEKHNNNLLLTTREDYVNISQEICILCGKCENKFKTTFKNYKKSLNKSCPSCYSISLGEEKVKTYLENNNINYIPQKTFEDCKHINKLPFDFYIPSNNILIEYQGIQHEKAVNFGGISDERAEENFKQQKLRDGIKETYCENNNIPLIKINYTDFNNINQILTQVIIKEANK